MAADADESNAPFSDKAPRAFFGSTDARSNPKPQVSGTTDVIAAKIMTLSRARVPAACPIEAWPPSSGRPLEHCP